MIQMDPGMPRRVLDWAQEHGGVHSDCLVAADPCQRCIDVVVRAFDHFYGQAPSVLEVLRMIQADFEKDEEEDRE